MGLFGVLHRDDTAPAPSVYPSASASALNVAPAPPAPVPELVDVVIRAVPAAAHIEIDGVPVTGNPFRAQYPKDNRAHVVTASAQGYQTKIAGVAFSGSIDLDLHLDPKLVAPAPAYVQLHATTKRGGPPQPPVATETPSPNQLPPPTPPAADVDPAGGRAPIRPIDTSSPY
jgi:hypothetical protein